MVWYSHLFQKFPQFIVIHTVKGFVIVNKAEIDVFLELSCLFDDPADVGNLISGFSAFLKPTFTSGSSRFTSVQILLKPGLENFRHHFTSMCFFDDQMYVGNLISGSSGSQDCTTPKCCHKGRNKNRRTSLLVQW